MEYLTFLKWSSDLSFVLAVCIPSAYCVRAYICRTFWNDKDCVCNLFTSICEQIVIFVVIKTFVYEIRYGNVVLLVHRQKLKISIWMLEFHEREWSLAGIMCFVRFFFCCRIEFMNCIATVSYIIWWNVDLLNCIRNSQNTSILKKNFRETPQK